MRHGLSDFSIAQILGIREDAHILNYFLFDLYLSACWIRRSLVTDLGFR